MDNIIILPDGSQWDNTLQLDQQTIEARNYFQNMVDTCPKLEIKDDMQRPISTLWSDNFAQAVQTTTYINNRNWLSASQITFKKTYYGTTI